MAEITLADLLAWDARLRLAIAEDFAGASAGRAPLQFGAADLEREITWAVTARATTPMLPPLRGGELVVLPRRVLAESGISLPLLLRELAGHNVVGVVVEQLPPAPPPLPTLIAVPTTPELEGEINRLLTQRRGDLYRAGTELERLLADLTTTAADLSQVLAATANALGVPVAVADARGAPLALSGPDAAPPGLAGVAGWRGDRLVLPLSEGRALWLGPIPRPRRALARLVGERVAAAAEAALLRAAQARPRGPARVAALAALLNSAPLDVSVRAAALGLAGDAGYRVAIAAPELGPAGLQRALAPLGTVHDAGTLAEGPAAVVEIRIEASIASAGRRPVPPSLTRSDGAFGRAASAASALALPAGVALGWLALSGPVAGPAKLPTAGREARYVAALLAGGRLPGPVARFDAVGDLGPYRLLFRLWGTSDLAGYSGEALGDLPARDRRGSLRQTLLAYLETGGSHVEAAGRLGIHRNTLAYRLKQIASLTGRDPTDPSSRLLLHLALLAASLPPAPEVSPNGRV
jgi:purine catabolism regulator